MRYMFISVLVLLVGFVNCSRDMSTDFGADEPLTPTNEIPIFRELYHPASIPVSQIESSIQADQLTGTLVWYNPYGQYLIKYIWPNKTFPPGTTQTQNILTLHFLPDSSASAPQRSWGGIMQHLDVDDSLFAARKYVDIMLHNNPNTSGVLHIDFGLVSEDVMANGKLNTEDKNGNGRLDDGEDVGLDGMANDDPRAVAAGGDFWDLNDNGVKDAGEPFSNDDYAYNPQKAGANDIDYSHINGTENNKHSSARGFMPDSEDLNGNGLLDLKNSYFSFALHLSHNHDNYGAYVIYESIDKNTGDDYGWRLYRIPLAEMTAFGSANWQTIETMRLWLDGFAGEAWLAIASIELTDDEPQEAMEK